MNNNKQSNEDFNIKIGKLQLVLAVLIILTLPIIIGIFITWPKFLFGHTSADANSWLGFWGSFLGGIIGTAGVIYVAYLQNREQRRLNEIQISQMKEENEKSLQFEKDKLYRESLMLFLNQLHEYDIKLSEFKNHHEKLSTLYLYSVNKREKSSYYRSITKNLNAMKEIKGDLDDKLNGMKSTFLILQKNQDENINNLNLNLYKTIYYIDIQELWGDDYQEKFSKKSHEASTYLTNVLSNNLKSIEIETAENIKKLLG
ncbi:hypothetical protein [Mammaliicoccus sciuri]|uniref:hypothetical protein n=1 Tax=Mammaliicoccus sciuri TaxID=1296 RepID=UPI002B2645ED|nr:hypothetical protein [Mammaliicoccus sciuri]WQL16956.1 hypothetical protein P3U34_11230 [Mammaliicoccus sciuri]